MSRKMKKKQYLDLKKSTKVNNAIPLRQMSYISILSTRYAK